MSEQLSSISVVVSVNDAIGTPPLVALLSEKAIAHAVDVDLVLVVNGAKGDETRQLIAAAAKLPDTTVVFLGERVHNDVARLVGIDHAIGDYILFCSPTEAEISALPGLLAPLREGYDVVFADEDIIVQRSPIERLLFDAYIRVYRLATGMELGQRPTGLRVFSRAAALFVAGRSDAEILLRARSIGSAFPAKAVSLPPSGVHVHRGQPIAQGWSRALRLLFSVSALPLRFASFLCMAGGAISIFYAMYVVAIFLFKPDVAPGWTTISLQLATMMFLFSLVFLFLCEYVIQIHAANPMRSRRHLVVREFRSPLSRRSLRLNVVDARGQYRTGAPPHHFGGQAAHDRG
jgi:hypothetical protein